MRPTVLFLAGALLLPRCAQAAPPSNALTLQTRGRSDIATPLALTPMVGLEIEHGLGATSFYAAPYAAAPWRGWPFQMGLAIGLRFYPFSAAPGGFFIGPEGGLTYLHAPGAPTPGFHVGVLSGFSFVFGNALVLSIGGGGEYFRDYVVANGELTTDRQDLRLVFRGGVGFAF